MNYKENKNSTNEEQYYHENILPKIDKMTKFSVPEDLWQNIKTNLQLKQDKKTIFDQLRVLAPLRFAYATAAVVLLLSLSIFGVQEMNMYKQVNNDLNSMLAYLSSDISIISEDIKL